MLWPAANLIAFAAIPQVRREMGEEPKKLRVLGSFVLIFLKPSLPPQTRIIHLQDLRILYSNAVGVAWCAYVSLSLAASAAATGGSLPPPPPSFDAPLE